jgi:hypothetical protein
MLTVETKVNRDSKSTNERGPSLVGSLGMSCRYKRFLFCLGCSSRLSTEYVFPHRTLFQFLCPYLTARWAGSRAGSPVSWYTSLAGPVNLLMMYDMGFPVLCIHHSVSPETCHPPEVGSTNTTFDSLGAWLLL